ncbi:carbohydrate ABC transporter permease, partial [Micromonospora chalcea]
MTTTTPTVGVGAQATEPTTRGARVRKRLNSRTATLVSIVIAMLWTIPTFGLFISSLRPENEIKTTGWWTFFTNPQITLENYQEVLFSSGSSGQLASYFINSLAITIPSVLFPLAFASLAAYALAWMNFKGRDWVYI